MKMNIKKTAFLIFIVTFIVYFNTLNGFFISDDYGPLGVVRSLSWFEVIKANIPRKGDIFIRPVVYFFWKLDYFIWHFNPIGYHLTNTVIHFFNSLLVAVLSFLLIKNKLVSLFAGILFAVHPIHPDAVVWIAARYDLSCTFFYLLSLVTFILYKDISKKPYLYFISVVSYPLAVLSKEMAISLPIILILWAIIFKRKQRLSPFTPYLIITFVYLALRFIYIGDMGGYRDFEGKPLFLHFNLASFLWRMLYNIPRNLILPMNQEVIGQQMQSSIALLLFLCIALAIYFKQGNTNKRVWLFMLSCIGVNLMLVHNIAWVSPVLEGGRLLYLPSAGFCIIFAYFLLGENNIKGSIRKASLFIIAIFCLIYMFIIYENNRPWNICGKMTGQIPKITKDYSYRFKNKLKLYFLIPHMVKGTSPYGQFIPETIAPILLPIKAEDVLVLSEVNYGDISVSESGEYRAYDFDLREQDFRSNLGRQAFFFRWNEATNLLDDISAVIKSKLDSPKQGSGLPKTYQFINNPLIIKDIHVPVASIGAIELSMRIKSREPKRSHFGVFWLSNHDTGYDLKKHIYCLAEADEEFHTYRIPFYLFNPDWLGEVYLEELKLQFGHGDTPEVEYIKFLPYKR